MKIYNPKINYILKIFKCLKKEKKYFTFSDIKYYNHGQMATILHNNNNKLPSFDKLLCYCKENYKMIEFGEIKNFEKLQSFCNKYNLKWCTDKPLIIEERKFNSLYLDYDLYSNAFMRRFNPSKTNTRKYMTEEEFYEWYPIFIKKLNFCYFHLSQEAIKNKR